MRLIPEIAMFLSGFSIISFLMAELGYSQIPVLYPFGVFLHEFWFCDYQERYKRHYGNYAVDGPPLILTAGDSGPQNWPYAAVPAGNIPLQYTDEYTTVARTSEKYTPVDGIGGVVKSTIKDSKVNGTIKYCFPGAQEPNDYIANRFLGQGFSSGTYSDMKDIGSFGKSEVEYNKNVFKAGTPFTTAEIGANLPNDPRWNLRAKYVSTNQINQMLVPLTTKDIGGSINNPQVEGVFQPERDYSGAEYPTSDPTTSEHQSLSGAGKRPYWYSQTYKADYLYPNSGGCGAWIGDDAYITSSKNQNYPYEYILPEFTTPIDAGGPHGVTGWGEPWKDDSQLKSVPGPREMQYNFIETQLLNENPIGTI